MSTPVDAAAYRALVDPARNAAAFRGSAFVRRLWPETLRERSAAWFGAQGAFDRNFGDAPRPGALADAWQVLDATPLRCLPLLLLQSEPRLRDIARRREGEAAGHPVLAFHLGVAALADRDYGRAEQLFAAAGPGGNEVYPPALLRALALGLGGRRDEALAQLAAWPAEALPPHARPWREFLLARLAAGADGDRP
jgi:hypothetical protein